MSHKGYYFLDVTEQEGTTMQAMSQREAHERFPRQMEQEFGDWRDRVPARFGRLEDVITVVDIVWIFGYNPAYVRRLRARRLALDLRGETGYSLHALPPALPASRRPLYWRASEVITWGMQSGRLDPDTGEPQRLYSPGAPPKSARSKT
jgi:FAD/FMN-containing dehydrogenase